MATQESDELKVTRKKGNRPGEEIADDALKTVTILDSTPEPKPGDPLPNERTLHIKVLTKATGATYEGDFTFKRLRIGEIAELGVEISRRNGGVSVDAETAYLNTLFATLSRGLVKKPDWFDPENMYDINPLSAVYGEYLGFEGRFLGTTAR